MRAFFSPLIRFFKESPVLFRIWYHLYRRWNGVAIDFFGPTTALYLDGYPRSGNTFSIFLVQNIWPDLPLIHHFHAIAPIKIALGQQIPVIILIRDPAEAISSYYLKYLILSGKSSIEQKLDKLLLQRLVQDYLHYYKWIFEHRYQLNIVEFRQLVSKPELLMQAVNRLLPNTYKLPESTVLEQTNLIKNREFGSKDILGSSRPNEQKELVKSIIKDALNSIEKYGSCITVYNKILEVN